jgi:hypothetical protein
MNNFIQPGTLQQLWKAFTNMPTHLLFQLSDNELGERLFTEIHRCNSLSQEEISLIKAYINQKMPLFRDLSDARLYSY